MITLLIGENSFETTRLQKKIEVAFDGIPERVDGSELELKQLPDLLMGMTLFATKRLVIIKNLSENKTVWTNFGDWLGRVGDDVHLVLVEPKPDKRTKTYKDLQKVADIYEAKLWTDRDETQAEQWVVQEAKALGLELDKKNARLIVRRVGVDQWLLAQALEKLTAVVAVTPEVIEDIIEANPTENVFNLLDSALRGDALRVKSMLETLEVSEDPYRLFGLLGTQVFQLAALGVADKPSAEVAKDLGAHPFALSKLAPHAKKLGPRGVQKTMIAMAEADQAMKISAAEPWLLIERALIKIASI